MDGEVRYGSAAAVPSRLDEPPDAPWTVIVLASEAPERVSRLLAGLRAHAPGATQVVVVANDPSEPQQAALAAGARGSCRHRRARDRGAANRHSPGPRRGAEHRAAARGRRAGAHRRRHGLAGRRRSHSAGRGPGRPGRGRGRSLRRRRRTNPDAFGRRPSRPRMRARSEPCSPAGWHSAAPTTSRWGRSTSASSRRPGSTSGGACGSERARTPTGRTPRPTKRQRRRRGEARARGGRGPDGRARGSRTAGRRSRDRRGRGPGPTPSHPPRPAGRARRDRLAARQIAPGPPQHVPRARPLGLARATSSEPASPAAGQARPRVRRPYCRIAERRTPARWRLRRPVARPAEPDSCSSGSAGSACHLAVPTK